jgi:hypothetical protein
MRFPVLATAMVILAIAPTTGTAQDDVARRSYAFLGDHLDIEIHTAASGSIQVLRGGRAALEVAARVPGGIPAFGFSDRTGKVLRLSATRGTIADFTVVIPERVSVTLWLPGNTDPLSLGLGPTALHSWPGTGSAPSRAPEPEAAGGVRIGVAPVAQPRSFARSADPTYVSENAPHVVTIPDPANVRSVSVRIEGSDFRVGSSVPLRTIPGNAERLEIRTDGPPIDLVLQLPSNVAGFMLKVGPEVAFAVNQGEARALCSPVITHAVAGGGRWFDFTPRAGRLDCQP